MEKTSNSVGESFFENADKTVGDGEQPKIVDVDLMVAQGKIPLLQSKIDKNKQTIMSLNDEKETIKKEKFDVIEENKLLKSDIETKNDMNNILQGKISSLELQCEPK